MGEATKSIVNTGVDRAANDLTQRLEKLGFKRTKKWYWVRLKPNSADFIHLHRSGGSYGGPIYNSVSFRVHCGNRALNDSFQALALNGPDSDSPEARERRYHLRFNAKSGSTYKRCIDDLEKFIFEIGEPWFSSLEIKVCQASDLVPDNIRTSHKLLGVKGIKP
jgi:hypothetical protein